MAVQTSVKPLDQNEKKTSIWGNILGAANDAASTAARNIMATPRKQLEQQVTANANKQNASQPTSSVYQPVYGIPEVNAPTVSNNGSIYTGINQNTLGNIKNIVGSKSQYDNSRYIDGTNDYETIANNAVQYYDALRAAGRSDIADYLTRADTETAVAYLNSLGIDTGDGTTDMSVMFGNLMNNNAPSVDISATWGDIQPILEYINGVSKPDPASQAANQAAVDNMNKLFDAILTGNNGAMNDSDRLMDMIAQYTGEQTARYGDLYNYIKNENFYDTDTAKAILDQYKALGLDAMDEATAEGISSNSGNIDSYAAANALRQQLDFTNAGNAAVLNQYNSNIGNMLSTLQSLGVDVSGAYGQMGDLIGQDQNYLTQLLGAYNTGSQTALDAVNGSSQYNTAAVVEALSGLLGLAESGAANDTSKYNAQLGVLGELLANRDSLASAENQLNAEIASAERQLSAANAANLEMLNAELASNERISANELAQAMEIAGIERELTLAELENAYRIASEGNASNERISASQLAAALQEATLNADVDRYVAGLGSATDKYIADRNAETNKYAADTEAASNRYTVDAEKEMNQANIDADRAASQNAIGVGSLNPHDYTIEEQISIFNSFYEDVKKENPSTADSIVFNEARRRLIKSWGLDKDAEEEYAEYISGILGIYYPSLK